MPSLEPITNRPSSRGLTSENRYNSLFDITANGLRENVPNCRRFTSAKSDSELVNDRKVGILVLFTVPLAWGTFEPAVRYVYEMKPAVPGFVFSVAYYFVAAVALLFLSIVDRLTSSNDESSTQPEKSFLPLRGGIELGSYLFLGNALQVIGLQTVPSDRAAFLLQLTTIFVPLVQATINRNLSFISRKTWAACCIALLGVVVIGLDGNDGLSGSLPSLASFNSLSDGDAFIVAAAFSYTFHCIRLERFAKETSAIKLAAAKATTEFTLCLTLTLALMSIASLSNEGPMGHAIDSGKEIFNYFATMAEDIADGSVVLSSLNPAFGAVLWTGLVSVAYTIVAQSYGQSRVDPITANLIYTIQPLCTALFAFTLLGETMGPTGYLGGALIGSAVYLVADD